MINQQYLDDLLRIYLACLVAFTSPGPSFIAVTSHSIESRTTGYGVALGISIGTAIWALFASIGLTAILSSFELAGTIISIIGGTYLLWLGFNSLKSGIGGQKLQIKSIDFGGNVGFAKSVIIGATIKLTNPKTALFWLALTSIGIRPNTPVLVIALLVAGCFILAVLWHCLLALAFSTGPLREAYIRYKPIFSTVFGVVFIGYGFRVFYSTFWR
jgi:threonine/homoserine/homoserine lactone efflux protein